ncbi:carbohydrate-binding family 9-like protein [Pontibacter saemangeumensis]|uniref:Carbohydrate-binding family 9-like protein n=1 Tax=Pontibacter saemangeumensis TaxID=1084525 RepID=A0ABP8M069_9BACT
MKNLDVPQVNQLSIDSPLSLVSETLDTLPQHALAETPWPTDYKTPEVRFAAAYNRDCLFLKYYVRENTVRALYLNTNDPVYKDSCVEFFVAFDGEPQYYNLEFNSLGTCLAGFGQSREDRQLLSESAIAQIRHAGDLQEVAPDSQQVSWQLTLAIPAAVFSGHTITDFKGTQARANFYKCGDELPEPHFVAWSPIQAPQPDFHLPAFFGGMRFI